jgi:hypothetical protein
LNIELGKICEKKRRSGFDIVEKWFRSGVAKVILKLKERHYEKGLKVYESGIDKTDNCLIIISFSAKPVLPELVLSLSCSKPKENPLRAC